MSEREHFVLVKIYKKLYFNNFVSQKEKEDGPLCKFYEVIQDLGANNQFLTELTLAKDITLFAPSNEAWNEFSVQNILQ